MNDLERLEQLGRSLDEVEAPVLVLETVTKRAPVLMCTFEHEPGQALRFEWVSDSWMRLLGYNPSELVGKTLKEVTLPEDHFRLMSIALLRHGITSIRVRKAPGSPGSNRYVRLNITWARYESDTTVFATILCVE